MICVERKEPEKMGLLRILLSELPVQHQKRPLLESELVSRKKGFKGEKEVDFYLRQLSKEKYYILNGLRLNIDGEIIQMDTLILNLKFFLITEIKNYSRKIILDTIHDQFIHITSDGTPKRSQNPLKQAARHRIFFSKLLYKHGFATIPIETFAVNSNPETILETIPENPQPMPNLFNAENLVYQIHKLDIKYTEDIWNETDIKSLVKLLKKLHTPPTYNLLKEYKINIDELIKGVPCPNPDCNFGPIERSYGIWWCPRCGCRSRDAHVPKIHNYLTLVKSYITNKECREICKLPSDDTAKRLLKSMGLLESGKTKSRKYFLDKKWGR